MNASLATRPGSARLTVLVLLAVGVRSATAPLGALPSAVAFGGCLLAILALERPPAHSAVRGWAALPAIGIGLVIGAALVAPAAGAGWSARPLAGFWQWGAAVAVIATLEEGVIRGRLQGAWAQEAGLPIAWLASAITFAAIHLPMYGLGAFPIDFAAGLVLAGLRTATGRVLPCAVAHTVADWGAWFVGP